MKYKFKRVIFLIVFLINFLYLIILFNNNGWEIIKPYERIECPIDRFMPCEIPTGPNEPKLILQPGEYSESHNVNLEAAKKFNQSVIISLILGLIINHFFFNRNYPVRKKLTRLKNIIQKNS